MKSKINNQNLTGGTSKIDGSLTYRPSQTGWGITGFFQGYKLTFSGVFEQSRLIKEKWQKFWPFDNTKSKPGPNSIVGEIDVYTLFSARAKHSWNQAFIFAKKTNRPVRVEDIFLALLKEPAVKDLFTRLKVSTQTAETLVNNYLKLKAASSQQMVEKIPFEAFAMSVKLHDHKVGSLMLLGALLTTVPQENILQAIFSNIGLTLEKLELFAVWILNLNYQLPENSYGYKLLYCCRQAETLEQHFGYFYELPAIEAALELSHKQALKDLEHKKALQLLVKAGQLAKNKGSKIISESLIKKAWAL